MVRSGRLLGFAAIAAVLEVLGNGTGMGRDRIGRRRDGAGGGGNHLRDRLRRFRHRLAHRAGHILRAGAGRRGAASVTRFTVLRADVFAEAYAPFARETAFFTADVFPTFFAAFLTIFLAAATFFTAAFLFATGFFFAGFKAIFLTGTFFAGFFLAMLLSSRENERS